MTKYSRTAKYEDLRSRLQNDAEEDIRSRELSQYERRLNQIRRRLRDQASGECVSLVAALRGEPVGYIHVYPDSRWGAFGGRGWPEIMDFNVLKKHRRRGVGSLLMDVAEAVAARYCDTVYLGVGLHSGYGSAQRLYVRRGYIPDGTGVWYRGAPCPPYGPIEANDDELVLYLSKTLRRQAYGDQA